MNIMSSLLWLKALKFRPLFNYFCSTKKNELQKNKNYLISKKYELMSRKTFYCYALKKVNKVSQ